MKTKLTKAERELMQEVRDEWIGRFNRLEFDEDKTKELINYIYELSGLEKPKIITLSSPMGCQLAANMLSKMSEVESKVWSEVWSEVESEIRSKVESKVWSKVLSEVRSEVWSKVWSEVWSKVWSKVESKVRSEVWSKVGSEVGSEVRSEVWSKVKSEIRSKVESKVWSKVRSKVRSEVESKVWSKVLSEVRSEVWSKVWSKVRSKVKLEVRCFYPFYYGDVSCFFWVSFYDFFTRIGTINNKKFNKYCKLIKNAPFYIIGVDEGYCFISKLPKKLIRNHNGQMDSKNEPAIQFADGYCQYYVKGVSFDKELWTKAFKTGMTAKEILSVKNAEQKAILIEHYGYENIIKELDVQVIESRIRDNKFTGKKNIKEELIEFEIHKGIKLRALRLDDHSQDKTYIIGVPRTMKTVLEALAWMFPVEGKNYAPEMES